MRTPSMVPSTNWSEADKFAEHANLDMNTTNPSQELVCVTCVQLGVTEPPRRIAMVAGTSLCTEHM